LKYDALQRDLGYRFEDRGLLVRALTHRSVGAQNYERLEFLGDGLLNFVVGAALYEREPGAEEGALSLLRAALVREETLARCARGLRLGQYLELGESERKSGGNRRDSILADVLEALIGAVYLDGGFAAAQAVCLQVLAAEFSSLPDPDTLKDSKTRLQEWLQARSRPLPNYEILSESGPPHRRVFRIRCTLSDAGLLAEASGASRRAAEQDAARKLLESLDA
jgi:ribonuclease III